MKRSAAVKPGPTTKAAKRAKLPKLPVIAEVAGVTVRTGDLYRTRKDNAILPLIPPLPVVDQGRVQVAPHLREVIKARLPDLLKASAAETMVVQLPGFRPPAGRVIDYDFALLVFAEAWLNLKRPTSGSTPSFADVRTDLPDIMRSSPAKACLMSLRGDPWAPKAEWPDHDDVANARWTMARCRRLHAAGLISMPERFHDGSGRSYAAALTTRGLARAVWLAGMIPGVVAEKACPTLLSIRKTKV